MTRKSLSVLILYNVPRHDSTVGGPSFVESDAGVLYEVEEVVRALKALDVPFRVAGVTHLCDVPRVLSESPEPVVFNLVEGFHDRPSDMNFVPALCRAFGKSATGNDTACLALAYDKWRTRCVLRAAGVPCPPGALVPVGAKPRRLGIGPGPYIVKPVLSDASEGIDAYSVVKGPGSALDAAVARMHRDFSDAALVEKLVGRREINAAILQTGGRVEVLPLSEIDFSAFEKGRPRIVGYTAKWLKDSFEYQHTPHVIPAPIAASVARHLRSVALAAWYATGSRDYARVDMRLCADGRIFVLEVNPNPDITHDGGFVCSFEKVGVSYKQFVEAMVLNAFDRLEVPPSPPRRARTRKTRSAPCSISIRSTRKRDREPIKALLVETAFFRPDEIAVAMEVLDDAIAAGREGDYQSFVLEIYGRPAGWVCFGPTPCTIGTYDVYWIAVDRRRQSRGLGTALLSHAEKLIRERGGRIAVIETSGREIYDPTRRFYLKNGYSEKARLKDFYAPGDDKIIYTKLLA